jgi:hypothetical protein
MSWLRRRKRGQEPHPTEERDDMPTTAETPVREPAADNLAKAQSAVELGEKALAEAERRRDKINRLADEIKAINRDNGFADVIRRALGS